MGEKLLFLQQTYVNKTRKSYTLTAKINGIFECSELSWMLVVVLLSPIPASWPRNYMRSS